MLHYFFRSNPFLWLVLCWLCCSPASSGQPSRELDSLKINLPSNLDSLLFDRLIYIAKGSPSADTAIHYANRALTLAVELGDQKRLADAHYRLGQFYEDKGLTEQSVQELNTAIELAKKINYSKRLTFAYTQKGYILNEAGRTEQALQSFLSALTVAERENLISREGHILVDIGDFFRLQRNYPEALAYLDRAIAVFEATENQGGICRTIFTKAATYQSLENKIQASIELNLELLNGACGKNIPPISKAKTYNNIGAAYIKLDDYKNAEPYLLRAFDIKKTINNPKSLIYTLNELSTLYLGTGQYKKALEFAEKAYESAKKTKDVYVEYSVYRNLSVINSRMGNYKQSVYYNGLYNDLRDSIENKEQARALAEMRTKYETAKQESEIAAAKLEVTNYESRFRNIMILALCFVFLVILVFSWYWNRLKHKAVETRQLQKLDQMKSRYFTNISHELRTPLSLIIDPIRRLKELAPEEEQITLLTTAETNAKRILTMVNQMLDLAKLESDKMLLSAQKTDLCYTLKVIVQSFEPIARQKKISFHFVSEIDQLFLYIDLDKLEKVMYNLLANALKFTPEGGEVTILLIEREFQAQIIVKDSGIGIPADKLPHVFSRFYQVDDSATRTYGGTGIGLALAKELTQLHGGTISISSEEGKGTQVSVLLPLGHQHLKKEEIKEPEIQLTERTFIPEGILRVGDQQLGPKEDLKGEDATPGPDQPIVLIIEDQPDLRHYIRQQLSPKFRVLEAADGQEGLTIGLEQLPDLIISDIMMPKIDGLEVCRRFKKDKRTSHIPIILLTAKTSQEDKIQGLLSSADDYLAKPFDSNELLVRIENLIQQRSRLRQRYSIHAPLSPKEIFVNSMDQNFLQNLLDTIEKRMSDEAFGVEELSKAVGMSRSQLHRKLKALTGRSTNLFLREIRLKRARQLLEQEAGSASEIAYMVGFSQPNYFYKCFKEEFGMTPGQILKGEKVSPEDN